VRSLDRRLAALYHENEPRKFWRFCDPIESSVFEEAARRSVDVLGEAFESVKSESAREIVAAVLSEATTGGHRFTDLHRVYYRIIRPLLPPAGRRVIRRFRRRVTDEAGPLDWPIEHRFVSYQMDLLRNILQALQAQELRFVGLWPRTFTSCLVLTHDVESSAGVRNVRRIADTEERLGFRSSFNFVPDAYHIPSSLVDDLKVRGFEVGVHGLKHDGLLFSRRSLFQSRTKTINQVLSDWGASGYRSPMTHRHPVWMQSLDVEYDLSFFDTDPHEPMPGGVMTIWPFFVGRFVALPTTLMQDHTMTEVLGKASPEPWLEKAAFIHRHHGIALLNTHPDYLTNPESLDAYRTLLSVLGTFPGRWHALPAAVAAWWRARSVARIGDSLDPVDLPDGCLWTVAAHDGKIRTLQDS